MIRINLLSVERHRAKKSRGGAVISAAHRVTVGASVILVITVLGIGWWFWSLHQRSSRIDAEVGKAEAATQKLRSVLSQVQKFESRKAQLQQRVTLIEQLRKGQSAPVHVLDKISRSLPERLWLTDLKQTGSDFAINGMGTSLSEITDFVTNLENSKKFKRPVELIDSRVESVDKTGVEIVKFSIKATFDDPDAPVPPPPVKPAGRGGAARGAK
jgi:type IV pilus assembly protein PilN